jgi:hypothetical protein
MCAAGLLVLDGRPTTRILAIKATTYCASLLARQLTAVVAADAVVSVAGGRVEVEHHHQVTTLHHHHLVTLILLDNKITSSSSEQFEHHQKITPLHHHHLVALIMLHDTQHQQSCNLLDQPSVNGSFQPNHPATALSRSSEQKLNTMTRSPRSTTTTLSPSSCYTTR